MKKLFLFLCCVVIPGSVWLLSCSKRGPVDPCGPFNNKYISTGCYINSLKFFSYDPVTHRLEYMYAEASDTVSCTGMALQLIPEKKYYMGSLFHRKSAVSLFREAFACSPPIPYSDELVDSIRITCNQDYDQLHKAGDNLADLFDVLVLDKHAGINYSRVKLTDYLLSMPATRDELVFLPTQPPANNDDFIFTVKYSRTIGLDKAVFTAESTPLFLTKD